MTRSIAIRILALAAAIGLAGQALLIGNAFGLNLLLLSVALLAAAVALRPAGTDIYALDLWLPIAAALIITCVVVRADPLLDLIDISPGCLLLRRSTAASR